MLGQCRARRSPRNPSHLNWSRRVGALRLQAQMTSRVPALGQGHLWGKLKVHEMRTGFEFPALVLFGEAFIVLFLLGFGLTG